MKTSSAVETIRQLRSDVALQTRRVVYREGRSLTAAAKRLRMPRRTLIKIMNGQVSRLSLDFLVRVSVRAGLHLVLQTGAVPQEAGALLSTTSPNPLRDMRPEPTERENYEMAMVQALTPEQRLYVQIRQ